MLAINPTMRNRQHAQPALLQLRRLEQQERRLLVGDDVRRRANRRTTLYCGGGPASLSHPKPQPKQLGPGLDAFQHG